MPKRILFPWEVIYPGDWIRTFLRKAPHTKPTEEGQTQRGYQDPVFIPPPEKWYTQKRILFPWEIEAWKGPTLRKIPHVKPPEEWYTQRGQRDPVFIIKTAMPNRTIQKISLNKKTIKDMANHIIGEKMSTYEEKIFDADGDGKITLKDFIHRIKNVAGVESRNKIEIESFGEKISRKRFSHQ